MSTPDPDAARVDRDRSPDTALLRQVAHAGGGSRRGELTAAGFGRRRVDAAVRAGDLVAVGRGGLVSPGSAPVLVTAVRLRGRLCCASALAAEGIPLLRLPALPHLASARHRGEPGAVWHRDRPGATGTGGADGGLVGALLEACRCRPRREALAAVDAALQLRRVTGRELAAGVRDREPAGLRWVLTHADARAESVLESALRELLLGGGIEDVDLQVSLPGLGRVDLVVAGWLAVEADGFGSHSGTAGFEEDRRRDGVAAGLGYVTLRLTWADIVDRPVATLAGMRAVLARRGRGCFRTAV